MLSIERKQYIEKINKRNYKSSKELLSVIKGWPVINDDTMYVCVMNPSKNTIDGHII
jgi:tRNA uridine 5-carbamoylmethylation protein Kti12